jgi:hypothetical protein
MTQKAEHPAFEVLSDLLDGNLSQRDAGLVSEHLSACASCTATYNALAGLVASASDLPKSVLPPDDIWVDLRRSLNERKELVLPTPIQVTEQSARSTNGYRMSRRMVAVLAAAAVILIALSSGITALVLRGDRERLAIREPSPSNMRPVSGPGSVLPPGFRQTENEFNRTIEELKQAVDTQRGQLSPETIRTVDRSLAVVDSAIAEARAALLADPNNQMLVDLLSASYQRKLDLLRRTSELVSRT